jgi:hypothetical protein
MSSLFRACLFALLLPAVAAQAQTNPSFTLQNKGPAAVREFFATPSGLANWGQDRLNGKGLAAGARVTFRLPANGNCVYDLRVVFADGRAEERRALNTCQTKEVAVGDAGAAGAARSFRLFNRGSGPIAELAVRPQGAASWEISKMEGGPIPPDQERRFELPAGGQCNFDLRVRFTDGATREKHGADLCRSPDQAVQ